MPHDCTPNATTTSLFDAVCDAEKAWESSSRMLSHTNDCLFDAGRPDLCEALSNAVDEIMFPCELSSSCYLAYSLVLTSYCVCRS